MADEAHQTPKKTEPGDKPLYCSFCARSQHEVTKLIAGPAVFICGECVGLCANIISQGAEAAMAANEKLMAGSDETRHFLSSPDTWPTERHLRVLEARGQLSEMASKSLQSTIDILRKRDVSWAVIGGAMGISRQAAWERFG